MGGIGSGRGFQGGKITTSNMLALDVRKLHRKDLLVPGRTYNMHWKLNGENQAAIQIQVEFDYVILNYRYPIDNGAWQSMEDRIYFEWTNCHFGGQRVWFRCPRNGCGRRTAIVYGDSKFQCRHCHKLVYACQRENDDYRPIRQADAIRKRLGWQNGIANREGGKPKGMHWRTFHKLKARYDIHANEAWVLIELRLIQMEQRLLRKGIR